jgi:hypothetical protein
MGFYADHPEVEPNGALDSEITDVRDVRTIRGTAVGTKSTRLIAGRRRSWYEASATSHSPKC